MPQKFLAYPLGRFLPHLGTHPCLFLLAHLGAQPGLLVPANLGRTLLGCGPLGLGPFAFLLALRLELQPLGLFALAGFLALAHRGQPATIFLAQARLFLAFALRACIRTPQRLFFLFALFLLAPVVITFVTVAPAAALAVASLLQPGHGRLFGLGRHGRPRLRQRIIHRAGQHASTGSARLPCRSRMT